MFQHHQATEAELCQRMGVPVDQSTDPTEIFRRLMATRNEWTLYKRRCDATGEVIISAYPEDAPFPVYSNAVWWGDSWDACDYGRDFDFSRPFFEQFAELRRVVPREGTSIVNCENCDYNSHTRTSRNCYMNSLMADCEDVLYSYWMVKSKDTVDSLHTHESTLCYWCHDVQTSYNCVMLEASKDCSDCHFSFELRGCHNCIFSSNLNNKSYHAFNQPCSKEEFEALKAAHLNGEWESWQEGKRKFMEMRAAALHRHARLINCENCVGDHVYDCRNCFYVFDSDGSEDCMTAISASQSKNVINSYSSGWPGCEMIYNSCVTRGSMDIAYCTYTWWSNGLRYCDSCSSSRDCFGCIGLKHKRYCILNKQYSPEEYEALKARIIEHMKQTGEWGQFFPKELSVFAYNESAANDYFPLSEEEALARSYRWRKDEAGVAASGDFSQCEGCQKAYCLIPQERRFYEKMKLPEPRECPACRHKERFALRSPCRLEEMPCQGCGTAMMSAHPEEHGGVVLCHACYLGRVY